MSNLNIDLGYVKDALKTLLSTHRYEHSIRVSHECFLLSKHYKIDDSQAVLVGLIHDAAKEMDVFQTDLNFTEFHTSIYKKYPAIGHAFVLDVVVPAYFKGIPSIIIQAAMWHTTGKAAMSDLEKIIFIADFIEPKRSYKIRQMVYDLAYVSLEKAVFEIACFKLNSLLGKRKSIYSMLVDCYNFYNYKR